MRGSVERGRQRQPDDRRAGRCGRGRCGTGVRFVAIFEAAKGALILLAGFGALSLIHHDLQQLAEELVRHFHLDPASHYPRIFIEAADRVSDARLWLLAALAFGYAALHFVQGYGLWRRQRWAAWLAIAAAASYVPLEVYGLLHGVSKLKVGTLIGERRHRPVHELRVVAFASARADSGRPPRKRACASVQTHRGSLRIVQSAEASIPYLTVRRRHVQTDDCTLCRRRAGLRRRQLGANVRAQDHRCLDLGHR